MALGVGSGLWVHPDCLHKCDHPKAGECRKAVRRGERRRREEEARGFSAFTLVEVLVCVVVISMLLALLLPALHGARVRAMDARCRSNLHQHALAVNAYRASWPRGWPPSWDSLDIDGGAMVCPADPARPDLDYLLARLTVSVPRRITDDPDRWEPGRFVVSNEPTGFHPWRNAGYLDGHAGRLP
jgi:prepilin-type N-terminal cleavage/methylation domain-containing protein